MVRMGAETQPQELTLCNGPFRIEETFLTIFTSNLQPVQVSKIMSTGEEK